MNSCGCITMFSAWGNLDAFCLADGEHQFRAETQQSILVRDDQAPGAAVLSQGAATGPAGYDGGDDASLGAAALAQGDGGFVGGDAASDPVIDDAAAVLAQSSVQAPTPDIDIPQSLDEG
jgi:hypothetical protein